MSRLGDYAEEQEEKPMYVTDQVLSARWCLREASDQALLSHYSSSVNVRKMHQQRMMEELEKAAKHLGFWLDPIPPTPEEVKS